MSNINQDTDRTKAIIVTHISHTWIAKLDKLIGRAIAENGGFFDLFAPFRGKDKPIETDLTMKYRDYSGE